jgi:hypothetical protein
MSETVGRACCQPDFQSQAQLDSRVYIIGCASSIRLAPNLVSLLRPCDIARALYTLCQHRVPLCPYIRFSNRIRFDGSSRTPRSTRLGTSVLT